MLLSNIRVNGPGQNCFANFRPFSGIVFVLFAMSIKLSLFNLETETLVYFIVGLLYLATIFIIAGIDKERIEIEKPVLLFGFICVGIYMIYLYILRSGDYQ